jgi:hypothetical protein
MPDTQLDPVPAASTDLDPAAELVAMGPRSDASDQMSLF